MSSFRKAKAEKVYKMIMAGERKLSDEIDECRRLLNLNQEGLHALDPDEHKELEGIIKHRAGLQCRLEELSPLVASDKGDVYLSKEDVYLLSISCPDFDYGEGLWVKSKKVRLG
jgi:hypothetical protein